MKTGFTSVRARIRPGRPAISASGVDSLNAASSYAASSGFSQIQPSPLTLASSSG
jgi:hypothetical protein